MYSDLECIQIKGFCNLKLNNIVIEIIEGKIIPIGIVNLFVYIGDISQVVNIKIYIINCDSMT